MISEFVTVPYLRGGRDMRGLDCYGLVRLGVHRVFAKPLLPLLADAMPGDYRAIARGRDHVEAFGAYRPCRPRAGAIAEGYHGRLCAHFGLVVERDGMLMVMDTAEGRGVAFSRIAEFEKRFTRVAYYDN